MPGDFWIVIIATQWLCTIAKVPFPRDFYPLMLSSTIISVPLLLSGLCDTIWFQQELALKTCILIRFLQKKCAPYFPASEGTSVVHGEITIQFVSTGYSYGVVEDSSRYPQSYQIGFLPIPPDSHELILCCLYGEGVSAH